MTMRSRLTPAYTSQWTRRDTFGSGSRLSLRGMLRLARGGTPR